MSVCLWLWMKTEIGSESERDGRGDIKDDSKRRSMEAYRFAGTGPSGW